MMSLKKRSNDENEKRMTESAIRQVDPSNRVSFGFNNSSWVHIFMLLIFLGSKFTCLLKVHYSLFLIWSQLIQINPVDMMNEPKFPLPKIGQLNIY